MQLEAQRGGPVSLSERIVFIDILRGMALFGILAANMRAFFPPLETYDNIRVLFPGHADTAAQFFVDAFIQGKFVSIFSFLFGLGFAMQMSRAEARGVRFLGFYPRRLLALALFGVIHGLLIWGGRHPADLCVVGRNFVALSQPPAEDIAVVGGKFIRAAHRGQHGFPDPLFQPLPSSLDGPKPPDMKKCTRSSIYMRMEQRGRYWRRTGWNGSESCPGNFSPSMQWRYFCSACGCGAPASCSGFDEYRPVFKLVCAWCIPVGPDHQPLCGEHEVDCSSWRRFGLGVVGWSSLAARSAILSAGYATGLALLFMDEHKRRFLLPFAAVGRMALTDYLMQSVVCTLFFYHYTTGLFGRVGPAIGLLLTFILYGAQVAFSNWWLQRYRFGPMEWLWRGMTYGKFPSMYKEEPVPTIKAATPEVPATEAPALLSPPIALSAADGTQTATAATSQSVIPGPY